MRPRRAAECGVETGRRGCAESGEEVRPPPEERPGGGGGGGGRLAPAQDCECGERLLAQEGRRRDVGRAARKDGLAGRRESAACAPGRKEGKGRARRPGLEQLRELWRTWQYALLLPNGSGRCFVF